MKILDATTVIAFLREMDFADGLRRLSTLHRLVVPHAVVAEVSKPPSKELLSVLLRESVLVERSPSTHAVQALRERFLALGPGEVECVVLARASAEDATPYVVSDDRTVRRHCPDVRFIWTGQLLHYMLEHRLITSEEMEGLLGKLGKSSFYSRRLSDDHAPENREPLRR